MSNRKIRNSSMRPASKRGAGKSALKSIYSGKSASRDQGRSEIPDIFKQFQPKKKVNLSYRAYEIIPRNSPYGHHFKSLLNAESFVAQNEFQMALEIYQRLLNKIPLRSSRDKIETNIKDIESFSDNYEEPFSPKVQLDISYSGPPAAGSPQADSSSMPSPQGPSGAPIQIQMMTGGGYPYGPGMPGQTPGEGNAPFSPGQMPAGQAPVMLPFGFAQAQETADKELKEQLAEGKNKPFGFFDQIQDFGEEEPPRKRPSEDMVPQNNTEKLLKELSDGIFQIEKAIFDTSKMKVESETPPEVPAGSPQAAQPSPETPLPTPAPVPKEKPQGEQPEEATEETAEAQPKEEEAETGAEKKAEVPEEAEEAEMPRQEEGVTGKTGGEEEEEELGEGIIERTAEIGSLDEAEEEGEEEEEDIKPAVQEIRGVLELKEPEQEDTPFITITYDFNKIPHHFFLSKDHHILEYAYYKYKPMLVKAQRFIRKKQITKALNYYRVIRDQQIPDALKLMVDKNIQDISEYLEKYLMARPG